MRSIMLVYFESSLTFLAVVSECCYRVLLLQLINYILLFVIRLLFPLPIAIWPQILRLMVFVVVCRYSMVLKNYNL